MFSADCYKYLLNVRIQNPDITSPELVNNVALDFIAAPKGSDPTVLGPSYRCNFELDPMGKKLNTFSSQAIHPGADAVFFTVNAGKVAAGSKLTVDVIEFLSGSGGGTSGMATGVYSFANTIDLSKYDVSNSSLYPNGSIMFVWNSTTRLVETWSLQPGAPTGGHVAASGQPTKHWQKS